MKAAALWLLCTAKLVSNGEAVTVQFDSEKAVVRSANGEVVAQAAVKGRATRGSGNRARTEITFEGGKLVFYDVYGQAQAPRLRGLAKVSRLSCKAPNPVE